jgi:SAM-dependent methyltransferase
LASHLTSELWDFVDRWLPSPPARVLDVGCGEGDSTRRLREVGFDAIGLDPIASAGTGFVVETLEAFAPAHPFDAAVAIRSLHHVADLGRAVESLHRALVPGARLVLFEFDVDALDRSAEAWLDDVGLPDPLAETERHEVIPLAEILAALEPRFHALAREPAPYLAREAGRGELASAEAAAIARGALRPCGARLAYERR